MRGYPSPCVDVCRYEIDGHCRACSMTKGQKKSFDALRKPAAQVAFLRGLVAQQADIAARRPEARFAPWSTVYRRKCRAYGKESPLDDQP